MSPKIEQATTYTAILGSTPALILLPRVRAVHIAPSGALVTADAWTSAVSAAGALPMTDLAFTGGPMPGWLVTLAEGMTSVRIAAAELGEIFVGALVGDADWRRQVEQLHRTDAGLVVVTGTPDRLDPDAALEMMESERAVWARARTAVV